MPPNKATTAATAFVGLVLRSSSWSEVKRLSTAEQEIISVMLAAAGFGEVQVVHGVFHARYLEGGTYPVNNFCPFKAVDQAGDDYHLATGWLDYAFRRVVGAAHQEEESKLIKAIASEIRRSVPLKPIQLNPEGDQLGEYPPDSRSGYFVDHERDDDRFRIGVHLPRCKVWVDRYGATDTHDAIVCRGCHMRVLFPRELITYGDLRKYFASQLAAVPA